MPFYAHSTERLDGSDWEPWERHATDVGDLAGSLAAKFGAGKAGTLAGRLHDLGKLSRAFQDYIRGCRSHGPDHSTAGAREIVSLATAAADRMMAEVLAYGIAGHHGGLPDRRGDSSLEQRIARTDLPELDPGWRTMLAYDTAGLLPAGFRWDRDEARRPFQLSFLGRMLFGCLVDADRLCTEAFYARVGEALVDRAWPKLDDIVGTLIEQFNRHMAGKLAALPEATRSAPLNVLRREILAHVRDQASLPKGVFTLDVPTGSGKTLASLAFALEHARVHGMERIIYSIPFTSIIEQTAEIFRDVLGEGVILEHHSAIEAPPRAEDDDPERDRHPDAKLRRAMENWAAPVAVTTNVQLFDSLFSDRPSRCRKLPALANAVVILDEVQTLPLHVLRPCVAALDELARNYGCTVVLCTATQPALLAPRFVGGFTDTRELAPEPARLHEAFRRVTLRLRGQMADAELVAELGEVEQGLVIVNSRGHARTLYLAAKIELGADGLIHLTTRQAAADRQRILADVRRRLAAGERCRLVATSLVEAGVDLSFPRAWRAEAGLDQIIQAAGRVNREWKWSADESFVDVFRPESAGPPPEIKALAEATKRTSEKYPDLFAREAIDLYFREVYWQRGDSLDSTRMQGTDGRHEKPVLAQFRASGGSTEFAYRTVGEAFRLIRDGMEPVIVAVDEEPRRVLAEFDKGLSVGAAARALQRYLVQVPPRARHRLIENGHVTLVPGFEDQFAVLKTESFYSREEGLVWEDADELGTENMMV